MKLIPWTFVIPFLFSLTSVNADDPPEVSNAKSENTAIELKYQFAEGEQWQYALSEQGTQTAISEAVTQSATNNSSQRKHYEIVRVFEDGSALMEVVLDRFRIDFTVKLGERQENQLLYDTAGEAPPPEGLEGVKKSIGKPFARFRMSPSGEITELEFPQAIQPQPGQDQDQLKKTELRKGLPIEFPAEPITVGESWSEKHTVKLGRNPRLQQQHVVQTIYQLQAVEEGVAEISLNTIVQPKLTDPVLRGQMMQYLPHGTIRFDLEKGRILSRTERIDRRELGVGGPKTVMTIDNRKQETLIDPQRQGLTN